MDKRMSESLDRHITGNYGEDQFTKEDETPDCSSFCYHDKCQYCNWKGCACLCHKEETK